YCPPFDQLDALERLRARVTGPAHPSLALDATTQEMATERGLEVVDPEGVPIALFRADQIGDGGTTGVPEWLGNPSPRPYERFYLSPAQVRSTMGDDTL